jgi:uracil phosphoribosyltransferase
MEVHILDRHNTLLNSFIAQMREVGTQNDRMRFRRNLERCGEIMAYEISKALTYSSRTVETPLGEAAVALPDDRVVVATILRAGVPYHQGFLNYFDGAGGAFVSAFRKYSKDGTFRVKVEYVSCGDLEGRTLILADPMLATGTSTILTYKALVEKGGTPGHTHIASVIASEEGLAEVRRHLPAGDVTLWCGTVDEELTVKSYIIPGLGDAGDLAYGDKL